MDLLKKFNLPSYLKSKKTIAEMSKCIADKFEGRTDPESVETLNELQGRLRDLQEHIKAEHERKTNPQAQQQGMPQQGMMGQGQGMPGVMQDSPQPNPSPDENAFEKHGENSSKNDYNFGGALSKMFGAGAGDPNAEGFAGTQVGAGFQEGASADQIAGSAMGIAGGAMALGDMANTAFGDTGIDTSGRTAAPEVGSTGLATAGGAMKGAQAGMAFGPLGAAVGGVLGGASSFFGNKKAKRDAEEAEDNFNLADYNRGIKFNKYGGSLSDNNYKFGGYGDPPVEGDYETKNLLSILNGSNQEQSILDKNKVKNDYKITIDGNLDSLDNDKYGYNDKYTSSIEGRFNDDDKKSTFNPMELMRYAPVAMNLGQLATLKRDENVNLERLNNRYEKNYVDERSLQNMAKESALNTRDALMSASGGSGARASANLLASQNLANKGMSDAYFKANAINAAEDKYAQEFNKKNDITNLQQSNQEKMYDLTREAAYKQNKSDLLAAIGDDLGGIGQEEMFKRYPELMGLGYDWKGRAVDREEIVNNNSTSVLPNRNSVETKNNPNEAKLAENKETLENPESTTNNNSITNSATGVEGTTKGTNPNIKKTEKEIAEEKKRVAPGIYNPGAMETPGLDVAGAPVGARTMIGEEGNDVGINNGGKKILTIDDAIKEMQTFPWERAESSYAHEETLDRALKGPFDDSQNESSKITSLEELGEKTNMWSARNKKNEAYVDKEILPQLKRAQEMISDFQLPLKIDDRGDMEKGTIKIYEPEKSYSKVDFGVVKSMLEHEGFVQDKNNKAVFRLKNNHEKLSSLTGWSDGGNISDPRINKSIKNNVQKMFNDNKGLVVTGATRGHKLNNKLRAQGKAVKNSKHLSGKALDLRVNSASEAFMKKVNSDKKYKDSLGIEDVIKHHNHIHVEWK